MPFARSWRPSARLSLAALASCVTVASMLAAPSAFAAPDTTPHNGTTAAAAAAAQSKLDALGVQADQAVEAYNQASEKLQTATKHAQAQKQAVTKAAATVDAAKAGMQQLVVAEYEDGPGESTLAALLSDDGFGLQKAELLAQVNRSKTASLTKVVDAARQLRDAQSRADQSLSAVKAATAQLATRKAGVEKAVAAQEALAKSLQNKVRQEQAAAAAAAAAVAARAAQQQRVASRSQPRAALAAQAPARAATAPVAPPPAAGSAAAVLRYAYAQLGKPYQWGGAGPNSFDCSGLTMRAWEAAGVSLSHSSSAQQHEGTRVLLSAMQPGDLVFYGNPAYHVGIYVGGGRMIDAPHTGTVVQVRAIWGSPSGAVRP